MDKDSTDKGKRKSSNRISDSAVIREKSRGLTEEEFFLSTEDGSVNETKKNVHPEEKKGDVPKDQSIRFFLPETF
jgi:hypothetical protein